MWKNCTNSLTFWGDEKKHTPVYFNLLAQMIFARIYRIRYEINGFGTEIRNGPCYIQFSKYVQFSEFYVMRT